MFYIWSCIFLLLASISPTCSQITISKQVETPHTRNILYTGGEYVYDKTAGGTGGTILVNQQYVEELTPLNGVKHKYPLVFLHGGGISGSQWLNKPDGNRGWASYFLEQGYQVYIIDLWSVGRSSAENLPTIFAGATVELAELAFTAPELYHKYYQAEFHTQWPGNGTKGDPIFAAYIARFPPLNFSPTQENITRSSTCALLSLIGPSILISHSLGASAAFLATDGCPQHVRAHISAEGDTSPFASYDSGVFGANTSTPSRAWGLADVPIAYYPPITAPSQLQTMTVGTLQYTQGLLSQYPCILQSNSSGHDPRKLKNISQAPVLFLTGEASIHATYDRCLVLFLQQAGVRVEWVHLKDKGLRGNGHFSMLEKNSDGVAGVIAEWIAGVE